MNLKFGTGILQTQFVTCSEIVVKHVGMNEATFVMGHLNPDIYFQTEN